MRENPHALAGPYALDALHDDERLRFEAHLTGCEACETEVRQFAATTARLGMAVALPPPPHVRERVLGGIARVRQLPPDSWQQSVPEFQDDQAFRDMRDMRDQQPFRDVRDVREVRDRQAFPEPPDFRNSRTFREAPDSRTFPADVRALPRRRRGRRVAVALLAAACVAGAAVSGGVAFRERQQRDRAEAAYTEVASVLSAPDARAATGRASGGGTATIVASRSRGRVVFASSGLRTLPASHTYQLWLIGRSGPRSAGLLADPARPVAMGNWQDSDKVGLTVEPAGGSAQPTTTPLVLLATR